MTTTQNHLALTMPVARHGVRRAMPTSFLGRSGEEYRARYRKRPRA